MHRRVAAVIAACGILLPVCAAQAGGWTNWGTPSQIDVIVLKSGDGNALSVTKGIMVYGGFGNPGGCTMGDRFYIPESHEMFAQIYAAVLAANISGKKIRSYVSSCVSNPWYSASNVTYGFVTDAVNFGN
jgi:hypothetical protein